MSLFKYSVAEQYQSIQDARNLTVTILSALQPLVLTQDTHPPPGQGAIMVVGSMDLTVFADTVIIRGALSLPQRAVKIYARSIDTETDSNGQPASISVNGVDGGAPAPPPEEPPQAAAGTSKADLMAYPFLQVVAPTRGTDVSTQAATGSSGGNAGSIIISVESFVPQSSLSLFAIGGKGGKGQKGQQGGQGGNGWPGHNSHRESPNWDGGAGGSGGYGGRGGNAGQNGHGGTININYVKQTAHALNCSVQAGLAGTPGDAGPGGFGGSGGLVEGGEGFDSKNGNAGPIGHIGLSGGPCPTPGSDGASAQRQITYPDLAPFSSPDQRLMVLKTARTFYLSADPGGTLNQSYRMTAILLQWLIDVTAYFTTTPPPDPACLTPDEVARLANIHDEANGLAFQLSQRLDIYGNPPNFVPMGSYATYSTLLDTLIVKDMKAIEKAYHSYFDRFTDQNNLSSRLGDALSYAQNHLASLTDERSDALTDATALVQVIDRDQAAVDLQKPVLLNEILTLKDDIMAALAKQAGIKCIIKTLDPLLDSLKIVATISADKELEKIGSIGKQITGLLPTIDSTRFSDADATKLISSLQVFGDDVQSMADAYTNSQGLIISGAPNSYKVLQQQADFDKMLAPYLTLALTQGKKTEAAMHLYTNLVVQMNKDILKYNADIAHLATLTGQIAQTQSQITQAQQTIEGRTDPGLPAMVNFMSGLYQGSKALCLHFLYMTYRSYAFWGLDENSSSSFFGKLGLATPGDVNQASLSAAKDNILNAYAAAIETHGTPPERFPPRPGVRGIEFVIDQPDLLLSFRTTNELYFTVPTAYSGTSINESPFHGLADVRIYTANPWIHGAKVHGPNPADSILQVRLTHTGSEVIVRSDATSIAFSHQRVSKVFKYDCETLIAKEDADFGVDDRNATYALLGPFTLWHLEIRKEDNANLDLSAVDKITIEFSGTNYALP